jgi:hypothetical protein
MLQAQPISLSHLITFCLEHDFGSNVIKVNEERPEHGSVNPEYVLSHIKKQFVM